jgi:hypothetical protein
MGGGGGHVQLWSLSFGEIFVFFCASYYLLCTYTVEVQGQNLSMEIYFSVCIVCIILSQEVIVLGYCV